MDIWSYVRRYTYSSPERHIDLLVAEARKIKRNKRGIKILDVGGGLRDRAELERLGSRTVLDIEKGPGVDVIGDAHKLSFRNKSYDVIAFFMVLEHLHAPDVALRECQRVLKPGGLLLLTTVQYWHKHNWPKDYYRFTKDGLQHLGDKAGLKILKIWSMGGPFLVVFHAIELNLPEFPRKFFLLTCPIFNYLDKLFFKHEDKRKLSDSVGWSLLAQK